MTLDEDMQVLAAEYVLGTLDADERARVDAMLGEESEFSLLLSGWERRLGSLAALIASVEPQPLLWDKIRDAVEAIESERAARTTGGDAGAEQADAQKTDAQGPNDQPAAQEADAPKFDAQKSDAQEPQAPTGAPIPAAESETAADTARPADVIVLNNRLRRARALAGLTSAIAAALVLFIGVRTFKPDYLPRELRPTSPTRAESYVAMLQKDGGEPAFMLMVDADMQHVSVRRIGAEPQQGKSYQLWLVSSAYPAPRSLGVLGADSQDMSLTSFNKNTIESATYAISLEPQGGSPTGAPTGPVMYSGKLVARAS